MGTPMCSDSHCGKQAEGINATCKANDWPINHLVLVCDSNTGKCCNCTCSCFAWGTKILIPDDKEKVIQDFKVGDKVMASGPDLKWEAQVVRFSQGTGPVGRQPAMLHVVYGENNQELIVTMDHLFLVPGGKLKRADTLVKNEDFLVSPEGKNIQIHNIEIGLYIGGVHHIATSTGKPTSLDGHLLSSQGVVSADYAVQSTYRHGGLDNEVFLVANHENLPQTKDLVKKSTKRGIGLDNISLANLRGTKETQFIPSSALGVNIPDHAKKFFTEKQAEELGKEAKLYPLGNLTNVRAVDYLNVIFRAFYPQIYFLADYYSDAFNAYSWRIGDKENSKMFVVVGGGLMRVISLELEGLALVISHEVGHLLANEDETELACEGEADYYGMANVMRQVFYQSLYTKTFMDALSQVEATFNDIKKNRGKNNSCHDLSLDCRMDTFRAAVELSNLPECAGGPALLALEKAENTTGGLVLTFNQGLNAGSAQTVKNYRIEHNAIDEENPQVTDAIFSQEKPEEVVLTVEGLKEDHTYVVLVSNLYSDRGSDLNPEKSSASFKA